MTGNQFDIFLEALHLGDGTKHKNTEWTRRSYHITSARLQFVENLQAMAVTRGWMTNFSTFYGDARKNVIYMIHLKKQKYRHIGGQCYTDRSTFQEVPYEGQVWSVSNAQGTLITRRNGKTAILGSAPLFEPIQHTLNFG